MLTQNTIKQALLLFLPAVLLVDGAVAEILPSYYLRSLTVKADAIVVAVPTEGGGLPSKPGSDYKHKSSFKVLKVLKGEQRLADSVINPRDRGMFALGGGITNREPVALKETILFLRPDAEGDWTLVYLYGLTSDGLVVRPYQPMNPGSYILSEAVQITWEDAIGLVRRFLPQVVAVRALRDITDPSARNRAIFDWVRRHRSEFCGGSLLPPGDPSREPRTGWGSLENEVFDWILESGDPEDTWLALELRDDVSHFKSTDWRPSSSQLRLAHPEGRAFLLRKLLDEGQSLAARRTAAVCLASSLKPRRDEEEAFPRLKAVTLDEQEAIIRAVQHLALSEDRHLRREVLWLLAHASDPFTDAARPQRTKLAFPVLSKALLAELDGELIHDLVGRLNYLLDESEWLQLTGNPSRICVTLWSSIDESGNVRFGVNSAHLPEGATLPVKLPLERLGDPANVVETVVKSHNSDTAKPWPADWEGFFQLERLNASTLAPGLWKVRIEGVSADAQKLPWKSWHTCFVVP